MNLKSIAFMAALVCVLTGCTKDYHEVQKADVDRAFIMNSSKTFQGYFYQGSDETCHYFVSKWQFEPDRRFRIKKADLEITEETPFGKDEIGVFVGKPQNRECKPFAVIGKQTIYVEE